MKTRRGLLNGAIAGQNKVVNGYYTVSLNSNWQNSSINPDSNTYNSYESYSNKGVHNSGAIMYIDIKNYSSFKLYIRSYAEYNYDYVMVSQLDKTITYSTSYSDTSLIKAHTRGNQQSGTALSNYTLVEFTGIDGGEHRISVIYRKDSSANSGDDKGYVLIEKSQAGNGDSGSGDDEGGSNEGPIDINNYLTIVALENGLTAQLSNNSCEYCIDGNGNWKTLSAYTDTETINTGQTLSFRGNLTPASNKGIGSFAISKSCNLEGNCMSMLFGDNASSSTSLSGKDYAFYELFKNCITIKSVSANFLPATTLTYYCYTSMFRSCTSLTTAPELPATTLKIYCYSHMFDSCTSLTKAPELPAITLKLYCYYEMFYNCSKLNYIKMVATDISASYCLYNWVYGVASTGTFVKNPNATWDVTGYSGIPSGWTVVNAG